MPATESLLPRDDALDSLSTTFATCRVSEDEGKSWHHGGRIVQKGARYSPAHLRNHTVYEERSSGNRVLRA